MSLVCNRCRWILTSDIDKWHPKVSEKLGAVLGRSLRGVYLGAWAPNVLTFFLIIRLRRDQFEVKDNLMKFYLVNKKF